MKIFNRMLVLLALGLTLAATTSNAQDQQRRPRGGAERGERGDRGNFDPEAMRQRMMDGYKEALEVKSDEEWKVISERINKVNDARRGLSTGGGAGFAMFRRPGGDNNNNNGGGDQNRRRFGGEVLPEQEALQKALEAKASAEEIKTKLAKLRDARKVKEDALTKAQDDLKKVLTARQEATAVMFGLLK